VTALFVDVVDSTRLASELAPDDVARKLNGLFSVVVDAVSTHGGLVNKFQGDAALCIFGAPTRHADPATAALRTARAIRVADDRVLEQGGRAQLSRERGPGGDADAQVELAGGGDGVAD